MGVLKLQMNHAWQKAMCVIGPVRESTKLVCFSTEQKSLFKKYLQYISTFLSHIYVTFFLFLIDIVNTT